LDNFDQVMELFTDIILNLTFPADEVRKLKTRRVAELRLQRSQPGFLAFEMFSKVIYGDHPAARISPSAEEIQRLDPESLARFHSIHYRPNNALFAIVGDVKPAEVVAKIEKDFGSWSRGDPPAVTIPQARDTDTAKIHLVHRPGSVQTNLVLGNLTIEPNDPDYYALQVMNRIVGGGPSARLFLNLREDKGYTYGAYSNVSAFKFRGTFQANTEVRTNVTEESMKELMYELKRIRDEQVPTNELEDSKRAIIGSFALQLESRQSLITQKLYGLPADYWDTYPQKIAEITSTDVQRVARRGLMSTLPDVRRCWMSPDSADHTPGALSNPLTQGLVCRS
jgi:zinc protease